MVGVPTYVLEGDGVAHLPQRPVTVTLQVVGNRSQVQLRAMLDGGDDPAAVRPVPGMMVLPRIAGPTVLRVVPAPGDAVFPPATTVHVALTAGSRGDVDPDRAVLTPVDVSGLGHADLVSVSGTGDRLVVAAVKTAVDEPLDAVAAAARTAARGVLGVDQLPPAEQVAVAVVLDTSASMVGPTADGSVRAVVDLLVGLAQVIGGAAQFRVGLLGREVTWLPRTAAKDWGRAADAAVRAHSLTVGFRSAGDGLTGLAPGGNLVGYVITDAVPTDVDLLTTHGLVDGEARHLVALAPHSGVPSVSLPLTVVEPPPAGVDAGARLLDRPAELAGIVRSLVVGAIAPESTFAGRLS